MYVNNKLKKKVIALCGFYNNTNIWLQDDDSQTMSFPRYLKKK